MITEELINYIRQQLQKGLTVEIIFSNLVLVGWLPEDIKEGFQYIEKINQNHIISAVSSNEKKLTENESSKKHAFLILIIIIVVFISSIFYFFYKKHSNNLLEAKESFPKIEVVEMDQPYEQLKSIDESVVNENNIPENLNIIKNTTEKQIESVLSQSQENNVLYKGKIYHIFFHSLIVYSKLAFSDPKFSAGYRDWMITRDEFQKILPLLYNNNFILIDITSLYGVNNDGTVIKKDLYLPEGKKPLIISLDDLSYYSSLVGHGFADKLVFDKNGNVATEIIAENGKKEITRDGDSVPILDDFVSLHPDFSLNGAKGVIALTGYHGVLGYKTNNVNSLNYVNDIQSAKNIISKLKETGWRFASHSYSHNISYSTGEVSLEKVKKDAELWDKEVRPLVGETDIFIGPYGQVFKPGDPRRDYLVSDGFKMFNGVGMDLYLNYFSKSITMNRADIDGYRLIRTPRLLKGYFDVASVLDPLRSIIK